MPRYISKYVPIDFAIKRIAEHHFGGDEAAAWADVTLAIKEGAITKRPVDDLRTKRHPSDDMLSNIVARTVMAKGNQPMGEDNQELKNWPKGTWLRRELEEIHRQIFTEDGGAVSPEQPMDKQIGFVGRPSRANPIKNEMRRRAKDGVLEASLAAEASALCQWAEAKFPNDQTPKQKSMENIIRHLYWELRSRPPI